MKRLGKRPWIGLLVFVLGLALLSACNLPSAGGGQDGNGSGDGGAGLSEEDAANTLQAELAAQQTETAQGQPPASDTPSAPPTETPVPASDTPVPTSTPSVPMVSVSVNTNCRTGPSVVYDLIGALLEGEKAEVVAKSSSTGYWIIKNPDRSGECWLFPQYATVEGDTSGLPERQVPPTPTPTITPTLTVTPTPAGVAFDLSNSNVHTCSGDPYVTVKIRNLYSAPLESAELKTEDIDASAVLKGPTAYDSPFLGDSGDCPPGASSVNANNSAFLAENISGGTSGNTGRLTVTLCSADGLGGECATKSIDFAIP